MGKKKRSYIMIKSFKKCGIINATDQTEYGIFFDQHIGSTHEIFDSFSTDSDNNKRYMFSTKIFLLSCF